MSKYKVKKKKRLTPEEALKESARQFNWKLHIINLLSAILLFGIYQAAIYLHFGFIIHIYAAVLCVCGIAFGILNRGFSKKIPDADSLPEEWDKNQKYQYIEEQKKRRKKAKIFLIPIFGILVTFAFELVYLIYLEPLL